MTVDLDVPAGTETEIAAEVAALDDVTYAGLDQEGRERYLAIARWFLAYIGDDGYHWGCTSDEAAEEAESQAYDAGIERGFALAIERVINGLTKLEQASMVEAETVVEIVPRIRQMGVWDDAMPGSYERVPSTPVTSPPEQA